MASYYDVNFIERFIRQEAAKRGIDPDIAVRIARSEGLAQNTWQSRVHNKRGQRETSYGPFQLLTGGGLGDVFERQTGLQVEDPGTVQEQVKFALDQARAGGWTPWHGWKGGRWAGIRGGGGPLRHVGGAGSGAANFNPGDTYQSPGGETGESSEVASTPPDSIGDLIGDELQGEEKKQSLGGLLAELAKTPEAAPLQLSPPPAAAGNVQSLPEYIQQYIASRMQGGQPGGMGGQGLG